MHGARGGPKTRAGLVRCAQAATKHGYYSEAMNLKRRELRRILKSSAERITESGRAHWGITSMI